MNREENLRRLREAPLDVLILGGGINGAGVARDLALRAYRAGRPLRIGLVEKGHFASGTSGKNSQLIHGGLRYLKSFEFSLVREALHERATLLELAPHLVEPLPFLIPMYSRFARFYYGAGLAMYDLLAGSGIGGHRQLSKTCLLDLEPSLAAEGLAGGASFFDCRVHSARFVLENILDASRFGAIPVNYVRADPVAPGLVRLTDTLSGSSFEVRARKLIDAMGPWSRERNLRLVRGSHLVLPRVNHSNHAIAYFERGGRVVFVIPWGEERNLSLIGTTDVDHSGGPDAVHISDEEAGYLQGVVRRLFPSATQLDPIATYSSLRPLVSDGSQSPTDVSRGHRIWNAPDGILHISGGKYTTYRAMSEEGADLCLKEIAPELASLHVTASEALGGNTAERLRELSDGSDRLVKQYGVATPRVLSLMPAEARAGFSRIELARIRYAVLYEMAQTADDVLYVSTYWGHERVWPEERRVALESVMNLD